MYIYVQIHDILPKYRGLPLRRDARREGKGGLRPPAPMAVPSFPPWQAETRPGEPRRAAVTPSRPTPLPTNPQGPVARRQPALTNEGRAALPRRDPLDGSRRTWGGTGHPPPPSSARRAPRGRIPRRGEGGDTPGGGGGRAGAAPGAEGAPGGGVCHVAPEVTRGGGGGEALAGGGGGVQSRAPNKRQGVALTPPKPQLPGGWVRARPPLHTRGCPPTPPRSARRVFLSVPALCLGRGVCTSGLFSSCKFFVRRS